MFTFSDDAHGVDQVGTNYAKILSFAEHAGIVEIACLKGNLQGNGDQPTGITVYNTSLADIRAHPFFAA